MDLVGKVSWFGGPNDRTAGPTTASGASVAVPGIAVYNHATLGGYWRVTFPNGRTVVLRQTDIGPAPWTGRKVDVSYSALGKAGYSQGNFPTDGTVRATYLGNNPGAAAQAGRSVQGAPGPVAQGPTSYTIPGINRAPERHALLASYLLRQPSQSSNPIQGALSSSAGLLKTVGQMRAITDTPAKTVNVPGSGGAQTAGGGSAASMFPGGFKLGRIDQGQDLQANRPGGPVIAPGDGIVIAVPSDPSGFGPSYPVIHWTSGPFAGKTTYIGHTLSRVRPGQHVAAGQTIAVTGTRGVGNATVPGWSEIGLWGPSGPTGDGAAIARYFR